MFKTFAAACLAATTMATADVAFTSVGTFKVKHPAFLNVASFEDAADDKFLLISYFKAVGDGGIYICPDIKDAVVNKSTSALKEVKLKTGSFQWPNDVEVIPWDVFGYRAIVVPDGFLVPGHTNGGVYVITMDETDITSAISTTKISTEEKGYFYHMGEWIDLNNDGRKDFLTARSNAKMNEGQMVWFEHPEEGLEGDWIEHVVCTGCADVGIDVISDGKEYKNEVVVFAAEFFNEAISFTRIDAKTGEFIDRRVIDNFTILSAYNIEYVDINGDGTAELLVNNHETDDDSTGVYAYELPKDWMTGEYTKHTIASGFQNAFSLFVPAMSPGFIYPFYPYTKSRKEAAHLLIAGDGDYTAHIMTPTDQKNYKWDLDTVKANKGTVGALCFDDLDGDGWQEAWIPDYDNGFIELFIFSALESETANDSDIFLQ